jgi:C4-dicarboxylate transporter, DctM subunit
MEALMDSSKTTGMIILIITSTFVFAHFLGIRRIPTNVSNFLITLDVPRIYILIGFLLFYTFCGFFFDILAVVFLTIPIDFPAMVALGYDSIWFGIITVLVCKLSLITSPFGLNLFLLKGMVTAVTMGDIIMGSAPFMAAYFITVIILIIFPQIALVLPNLSMGY